jgi:hypothetical protein
MPRLFSVALMTGLSLMSLASAHAEKVQWVTYKGQDGPGQGKHIVFISGDEEYRSEEAFPMLGKMLAERHGFTCTVLFSQNPETTEINPDNQTNIPGMSHLEQADLVILGLRFRELPDEDMKYFDDYFKAGKPFISLRTSTHAFNYTRTTDITAKKALAASLTMCMPNIRSSKGSMMSGDQPMFMASLICPMTQRY